MSLYYLGLAYGKLFALCLLQSTTFKDANFNPFPKTRKARKKRSWVFRNEALLGCSTRMDRGSSSPQKRERYVGDNGLSVTLESVACGVDANKRN